MGTPYIECVNGTLVVSTLNHVLSQLKINIQINILFRKQNCRLPTHTVYMWHLYMHHYKWQAVDSVSEVLTPELKELIEQACAFEGKNRVPHPLLQSPHPVLLSCAPSPFSPLCAEGPVCLQIPLLLPSLSLTLSVFPHPRIYHTLVLSLTPSARDSWLLLMSFNLNTS